MSLFIVDAHLDIAYNALKYGRDPLQTVAALRAAELPDRERGSATVSFPELREGGVGLIVGTLFVLPEAGAALMGGDLRMTYRQRSDARAMAMDQLDYYHRLADQEENRLRIVTGTAVLDEVLASHEPGQEPLLGIVLSMEGADPILEPDELEEWVARGVRAVGLAWDDTHYAAGAWRGTRHGLTPAGYDLLDVMAAQHMILDLTHMNEQGALEALDHYEGPIVASHSNARAIVPTMRQLSDSQIRRIGERTGMIGINLFNCFLRPNHKKGEPKTLVPLQQVVAHIDHICQLLGSAAYVGLGTDMDGGFGAEDIASPIDSSADLPLLADSLRAYGYSEADVRGIMGQNWLTLLRHVLPS